jgi:hypothetical protein
MNIKEKYTEQINKSESILKLLELYPDLKEVSDRWSNKYLSCKEINKDCDKVNFCHSCGCCPDAVLYAMPYKEVSGLKIYSDPFQIGIGEKNGYGIGEVQWDSWKDKIIKEGFSKEIIDRIQKYFDANPTEDFDYDDDYGEDE